MELRRANDGISGPTVVFLPGIVAPAALRYAALIRELEGRVQAFTKDLEVYDADRPHDGYSIETEVAGLANAIDAAGLERFFLYGHSAGGAISLAFVAEYPERLLGLALDEPASDFSDEAKAAWTKAFAPIEAMPASERLPAFLQAQVAPGVQIPAAPSGPQPDWMASRPAGMEAFAAALAEHTLPNPATAFRGSVYYSFGSLTNPIWREMQLRLSSTFANFTSEEYAGLHHLNTSHAAEPARVAAALRKVWQL